MAFQIKSAESITASLIAFMTNVQNKITDFNIGSVSRTFLESFGVELEQLYIRTWEGLVEAIDTGVFKTFDFPKLAAAKASGPLTFSRILPAVADIPIAAGTQVKVPNEDRTYETIVAGILLDTTTDITITVRALDAGVSKNTGAATVTEKVTALPDIDTVSNPVAFRNGADAETDAGRKARFREFVNTLVRGTREAVEFGAKTAQILDDDGFTILERVVDANVTESAGSINVFIWNGTGSTSTDLVDLTTDIINGFIDESGNPVQGYKAAGVVSTVGAATEITQAVTVTLTIADGFLLANVSPDVSDAIANHFDTLGVGDDILFSALSAAVKNVPGVADVVFSTPTVNVTIAFDEVALLGTVTIS